MIPFRTQTPLPPRFGADHTATRLIASIAQALMLQGDRVSRHGTEVSFHDLPALGRLREIADGTFTVDRTVPAAPVLRLACHFRSLWWILLCLAFAVFGLMYWRTSDALPALAGAVIATVVVGIYAWVMVRIRLRFLIAGLLRRAAS